MVASMKICAKHFDGLRTALIKKGMWYLVDLDPVVLAVQMQHWLAGRTTDSTFCPLTASMAEIRTKAIELMGPEQMWRKCQGGHACPLCEVEHYMQNADAGEMWIDNITDVLVILCETNNIPRKQILTA